MATALGESQRAHPYAYILKSDLDNRPTLVQLFIKLRYRLLVALGATIISRWTIACVRSSRFGCMRASALAESCQLSAYAQTAADKRPDRHTHSTAPKAQMYGKTSLDSRPIRQLTKHTFRPAMCESDVHDNRQTVLDNCTNLAIYQANGCTNILPGKWLH